MSITTKDKDGNIIKTTRDNDLRTIIEEKEYKDGKKEKTTYALRTNKQIKETKNTDGTVDIYIQDPFYGREIKVKKNKDGTILDKQEYHEQIFKQNKKGNKNNLHKKGMVKHIVPPPEADDPIEEINAYNRISSNADFPGTWYETMPSDLLPAAKDTIPPDLLPTIVDTMFPKKSAFEQYFETHWYPGKNRVVKSITNEELKNKAFRRERTIDEVNKLWQKEKLKNPNADPLDESLLNRLFYGNTKNEDKKKIDTYTKDNSKKVKELLENHTNKSKYNNLSKTEKLIKGSQIWDNYINKKKEEWNNDKDITPDDRELREIEADWGVEYLGTNKKEFDETKNLLIENYSTNYEKVKGGNCVIITIFQYITCTRMDFDTFYKGILEKFIDKYLPGKIQNTSAKQMLHFIRPIWDGIYTKKIKSWRVIDHDVNYKTDDNWVNDRYEKYNPKQFFEISTTMAVKKTLYDVIDEFELLITYLSTGYYFYNKIEMKANSKEHKKGQILLDEYISFMSKYTYTIPFITYMNYLEDLTPLINPTLNDCPSHVFLQIYDTRYNKLINYNNNIVHNKSLISNHKLAYFVFKPPRLPFELSETVIKIINPKGSIRDEIKIGTRYDYKVVDDSIGPYKLNHSASHVIALFKACFGKAYSIRYMFDDFKGQYPDISGNKCDSIIKAYTDLCKIYKNLMDWSRYIYSYEDENGDQQGSKYSDSIQKRLTGLFVVIYGYNEDFVYNAIENSKNRMSDCSKIQKNVNNYIKSLSSVVQYIPLIRIYYNKSHTGRELEYRYEKKMYDLLVYDCKTQAITTYAIACANASTRKSTKLEEEVTEKFDGITCFSPAGKIYTNELNYNKLYEPLEIKKDKIQKLLPQQKNNQLGNTYTTLLK